MMAMYDNIEADFPNAAEAIKKCIHTLRLIIVIRQLQ